MPEPDPDPLAAGPPGDDDAEPLDEAAEIAREAWRNLVGPDGYLPVLLLLVVTMVAGLLLSDTAVGHAVSVVLTSAALVLTIFRSTRNRGLRMATIVVAVGAIALSAASPVLTGRGNGDEAGWLALTAYLVLLLAAFPLVLVRALQHRRVSINTICATVSAYLIIGLTFAAVYRLYGVLAPPFFAQDHQVSAGEYSYFSFVTLTTVGYGDLSPGSNPARAFVIMEAVLGQVFIVTALARVVSLLGAERRPGGPGPADTTPG